jgi:hypothetical protein
VEISFQLLADQECNTLHSALFKVAIESEQAS